jgi:hypothetical protein
MAKSADPEAEKNLGIWCCSQVRKYGGIVEQPARSHLWKAAGLPLPCHKESDLSFCLQVWQSWWGFPQKKATWLYFRGIPIEEIEIPLTLMNFHTTDWFQNKSRGTDGSRSRTTPAFAQWLVDLARRAKINCP